MGKIMKIRFAEKLIIKGKVQREVLSQKAGSSKEKKCAPPSDLYLAKLTRGIESASLCALKKGSLTVEAALLIPFFTAVVLSFFSFFAQFALAADLKSQAAAEAKDLGVVLGTAQAQDAGKIVIVKSGNLEIFENLPFGVRDTLTEQAVCRAWIGFTEVQTEETYVYITENGSVYHLYRNCTHLQLSVKSVAMGSISRLKNQYGEKYKKCQLCRQPFGAIVFITEEGNKYHSDRSCGGLKRTVRSILLKDVEGKGCCMRCAAREE